jgi:hypothetical protein
LLLGAALAFFFDRQNGPARRKALVKRLAGLRQRASQPDLSTELSEQAHTAGAAQ